MPEDVLVRLAAESQVEVMGSHQLESRPALQEKGRRRRLVQLSLAFRDPGEGHGGVARLEEDLGVAPEILVAIEDMLQVQAGHREERARIRAMRQAVHPVIALGMALIGLVVADHRREIADLERFMGHGAHDILQLATRYRRRMQHLARTVTSLGTLLGLCLGLATADCRAQSTIQATQVDAKTIRVTSPGRFETDITTVKGFGHTFFDLAHYPQKRRDLAPVL